MVRRVDRHEEASICCRKVFGLRAAKTRTTVDESMQLGEIGHERKWTYVKKRILILEEGGSLAKNAS